MVLKSESLYLRKMTINDYKMVFELWINVEGMGLGVWTIQKRVSMFS